MRIAYVTDVHLAEEYPKTLGVNAENNLNIILSDIKKRNIKKVIFGGDIGDPISYASFFDVMNTFEFFLVLGNHDDFNIISKRYTNPFLSEDKKELCYSFHDTHYSYIFLDSSSDSISDLQLAWLKNQIQETTKEILLYIHHPILKVNTYVDFKYPLKNREVVKDIIINSKKKCTVFCGHYHTNDIQKDGKIHQICTFSASFQMLKNPKEVTTDITEFGYRILNTDYETLETELIVFKNSLS